MTKNKYFVFSDVHGEYMALISALEEAGYNSNDPTHKLISLGDNFDRGPDSKLVWNFLRKNKAIMIKGNHEEMLEEALEKGIDGEFVLFNILHNGLDATIRSFSGHTIPTVITPKEIDDLIQVITLTAGTYNGKSLLATLKEMPLYYETAGHIFVHAGFEPETPWQLSSKDVMLWDIEYSHLPIRSTDKVVFIGHHHAARVRKNAEEHGYAELYLGYPSYGNRDENRPVRINNKVAIDPCSSLTKKVNVVVVEDYPLEALATTSNKEKEKEEDVIISKTVSDVYTTTNTDFFTIRMDNQYFRYDPNTVTVLRGDTTNR